MIQALGPSDRLAIVTYADDARVVMHMTSMDEAGKRRAMEKTGELFANGSRNVWDGLHSALELLRADQAPGRLQHCLLLAGSEPSVAPPRGVMPMLQRLKER